MDGKCKVLSPVGSFDILKSAVFAGADCVYISAKKYGARGFAENFSYREIREAVEFTHEYNVEVFVTVNVSILECEIIDVIEYVYYLYCVGVDGVIVEDIGLGSLISSLIPDLNLHASTQMTIHDYSFTKWLACNGYSSVNVSREVPIGRIHMIKSSALADNLDVDVEAFVHGAICYCYSGCCLMSSFLGGRSGNRGICAQPCRLKYSLFSSNGNEIAESNYLLSTRDLCTYHDVDKLVNAGVNTIKIEGRMKTSEYVTATTYAYKNAVSGNLSSDDEYMLDVAFNRGFSSGYMMENECYDVVNRKYSGNQGFMIGYIDRVYDDEIRIHLTNRKYPIEIVNGDGLKFVDEKSSCGMYVSGIVSQGKDFVKLKLNKKLNLTKDSFVYITYSKFLENKTKAIINEDNTNKVAIDLLININNERELEVKCSIPSMGKCFNYKATEKFQKAKNRPLTCDVIDKQLRKTGDTQYSIENIEYTNFYDDLFMPTSVINAIRRDLIEYVDSEIRKSQNPTHKKQQQVRQSIDEFKDAYKNKTYNTTDTVKYGAYITSKKQAEIVAGYDFIDDVYYDGSFNYDIKGHYYKNIFYSLRDIATVIGDKNLIWTLPALCGDSEVGKINSIIEQLKDEGIAIKIQTDNIGVASEINSCDCYGVNLNIYNNYTVEKLATTPEFKRLAISTELGFDDLVSFDVNSDCELEYMIFGKLRLMISEDNFKDIIGENKDEFYYLKDTKNNTYQLRIDAHNHSQIYDEKTLDLTNHIEKLEKTAIDNLSLDLRLYNTTQTREIMKYIDSKVNKKQVYKLPEDMKTYTANFKKGLYKK